MTNPDHSKSSNPINPQQVREHDRTQDAKNNAFDANAAKENEKKNDIAESTPAKRNPNR